MATPAFPMKGLLRILGIVICSGAAFAAQAEEPRELTWGDLAPEVRAIENPFLELSLEQTRTFRDYLQQLEVPEIDHTQEQQQRQRELRASLEADGFKPDELVVLYNQVLAEYRRAATATRPDVLGQDVKLPGYLLPLNIQDGSVTEFLLVPTVGACIHGPTPNPNQMVYVRFKKGFKEAGLFNPVWVRGELVAEERTEELFLIDGGSDVNVSYSMDAEAVWLY